MTSALPARLLIIVGSVCGHLYADPADTAAVLPKVLWQAPRNWGLRDWSCGPAGCGAAPAPPFRFVREELTGSSPKVSVTDSSGRTWSVKFGQEVIPECFASRFLPALGYFAETAYYVPAGRMDGVAKLRRAGRMVKRDGSFAKARFELRGQSNFVFVPRQTWSWSDNPFLGTRELGGLKLVMMLLSNWDAKDARDGDESNNGVFRLAGSKAPVLAYAVFDWGASLGRWGHVLRRDQSDCSAYVDDSRQFVKGVRGNEIEWGFFGKHGADLKQGVSRDDIRWLLPYLRRITTDDLRAGLTASGATGRQATCWAWGIQERIRQLEAVAR